MKFTEADTVTIKEIGKEIVKIGNDYDVEITNFFKKMTNIQTEGQGAWTGDRANEYTKIVALDKEYYENFGNLINEFGNMLITTSESIDSCIKSSEGGGSWGGM